LRGYPFEMDFANWTEEGVFSTSTSEYESLETPAPPTSKILLTITLSILAILTTFFNCLVITAIGVTRKLHHPANYLICSLAVTDLFVAVLVMPFSIMYIQKERWVMGQAVCTIWLSVDITCCTCSILHLAAIAIDRYRAITDAVAYSRKRTGARAGAMVAVVWLLSILISLPPILWRYYSPDIEHKDQCIITHHHITFTLYTTFGAFYIPLLLILILEASRAKAGAKSPEPISPTEKSTSEPSTEEPPKVRISAKTSHFKSRRLESRSESRNESKRSQLSQGPRISGARERKAASTLGLIIGAFVICWLPFFVKEVIVNTCGSCSTSMEMADFLTWLGYINSLINPLIYTIFNEDFKKAFQRLVRCSHYL
uniref:5-hydroxytryptamine receptor 1F n=1 Tax=Neogobius melanostomus TaxID=47308 RepID=A0A8C6SCP0_9GOBI